MQGAFLIIDFPALFITFPTLTNMFINLKRRLQFFRRHEDNLIVDKITYRFREPERFDIIVFPFEYEDNTFYIKRIIGLPGETVQIDRDGNIFINGEILEEGYGKEVIQEPGRAYEPITLGEDEYFVLGDNRNNSSDSRDMSVGVCFSRHSNQ